MEAFEQDIQSALKVLEEGGIFLYPTDTVWGIGCDATNAAAVRKIYELKNREESKSMIVLLAAEGDILKYVAAPDPEVFDFVQDQTRPTTIIFQNAIGFTDNLVAADGSVAIRIVKDDFCRHLIKRFRKPIVSTSANISGGTTPATFSQITSEIKEGVDYIVKWRQDDERGQLPSRIILWQGNGKHQVIRD